MGIASDGQSLGVEISPGVFEPGRAITPPTRKHLFRRVLNAGEKGIEFSALRFRCAYDLPTNEQFVTALSEAIAAGCVTMLRTPWEPSTTRVYAWPHVDRHGTPLLRVMDIEAAHLPLAKLGIEPVPPPPDVGGPAPNEPLDDRLLRLIDGAGADGLTMTQLIRKTQVVSPEKRTPAIERLLEAGLIVAKIVPTATKPKTLYKAARHA